MKKLKDTASICNMNSLISDTEYITYEPDQGIKKVDVSTNKVDTLIDADELVRNVL